MDKDNIGVEILIKEWFDYVKKIMYLTGSSSLEELRKNKIIKRGEILLSMSDNRKFNSIYKNEQKQVDRILRTSLSKRKPENLYSPAYYIIESGGKRTTDLCLFFFLQKLSADSSEMYTGQVLLLNFCIILPLYMMI